MTWEEGMEELQLGLNNERSVCILLRHYLCNAYESSEEIGGNVEDGIWLSLYLPFLTENSQEF